MSYRYACQMSGQDRVLRQCETCTERRPTADPEVPECAEYGIPCEDVALGLEDRMSDRATCHRYLWDQLKDSGATTRV